MAQAIAVILCSPSHDWSSISRLHLERMVRDEGACDVSHSN